MTFLKVVKNVNDFISVLEHNLIEHGDEDQTMTEAAFFTIGRSRTIGYGKIRPSVDYQSRLLNLKTYIVHLTKLYLICRFMQLN